ncbi:MAG TPA: hypothetical protein VIL42_11585 [Sphingomicrobium sp.]|jgi:hypothetical protein
MNRFVALIGAVFLTMISVASACTAAPVDLIRFTLEPKDGSGLVQANFRTGEAPRHQSNWSSGFAPSELAGLDLAAFRAAGSRPLAFALNREAGRLDCVGRGGESYAHGDCRFTPNPAFAQLLQSRGIGRPTEKEAFTLMAVNATRALIDALAAARYPTPSIDKLVPLAALDVDAAYIAGMARAGYRPEDLGALIQFKALGIDPAWVGQVRRMGYAEASSGELVQLKALDITPEFIAGFERIGYRHLPVSQLVQLRALDITPEFVQKVAAMSGDTADVGKVVQAKALGLVR